MSKTHTRNTFCSNFYSPQWPCYPCPYVTERSLTSHTLANRNGDCTIKYFDIKNKSIPRLQERTAFWQKDNQLVYFYSFFAHSFCIITGFKVTAISSSEDEIFTVMVLPKNIRTGAVDLKSWSLIRSNCQKERGEGLTKSLKQSATCHILWITLAS